MPGHMAGVGVPSTLHDEIVNDFVNFRDMKYHTGRS